MSKREKWIRQELPCGCIVQNREEPYSYNGVPTFYYERLCEACTIIRDNVMQEIKNKLKECE